MKSSHDSSSRIILIGGIPGSGKTTVSKALSEKIDIAHRIGTGFMREALRAHVSKKKHPYFFDYTFRCRSGLKSHYTKQARLVCRSVDAVIRRADNEGTSIIIEGSHLLPSLIKERRKTVFVILDCDDSQFRERIHGKTHSKRKISADDLEKISCLRKIILEDAKKNKVRVIKNDNINDTLRKIAAIKGNAR